MIKQNNMSIDFMLEDLSRVERLYQYPSLCVGYTIWKTKWSDSKDDNGKFNRYIEWGPFQDLVESLERIGLFDNKIVLQYKDGLCIGFFDGSVMIGQKVSDTYKSPYSVSKEEILERCKRKK